jgi:hypothetical protein
MEIWMEPVGGAVGPIYDVEWYRIMDAFRQSHAEREKVMRDYPEEQLLDQLLLTLRYQSSLFSYTAHTGDLLFYYFIILSFFYSQLFILSLYINLFHRAEVKDDSPEEVLKCNLLVFLQENVMYFLAEDAQRYTKSGALWCCCNERAIDACVVVCRRVSCSTEKVCGQLNSILNHIGESNGLIFIKCNVLATLTTILLELELIRTQVPFPPASLSLSLSLPPPLNPLTLLVSIQPRVFESFVEVLFDIISHINSPADRVLRAAVRPSFFIFFKAATCRRATSNSRGGLFVWACGGNKGVRLPARVGPHLPQAAHQIPRSPLQVRFCT